VQTTDSATLFPIAALSRVFTRVSDTEEYSSLVSASTNIRKAIPVGAGVVTLSFVAFGDLGDGVGTYSGEDGAGKRAECVE
jgi:hypothetical protein